MHSAPQSITVWWFMTVHLKKLSVGTASIDSLRGLQARRIANVGQLVHITRNRPRRAEELLDGGSIYWIIKGVMTARQAIIDFVEAQRADGVQLVGLFYHLKLLRCANAYAYFSRLCYLEVADAPIDVGTDIDENMPSELVAELRELGIFWNFLTYALGSK